MLEKIYYEKKRGKGEQPGRGRKIGKRRRKKRSDINLREENGIRRVRKDMRRKKRKNRMHEAKKLSKRKI